MSVDYIVQYACAVRQQVQDAALLEMIKTQNRIAFTANKLRAENPQLTPQQIIEGYKVGVVRTRPDGKQVMEPVLIKDLLAQVQPLQALGQHCSGCAANLRKSAFGCVGAVNYPIGQATEAWLLSRLPDDAKAPWFDLLLRFLADFKVDGAPVDSQRRRREVYELAKPLQRKWGGLFSGKTISSSQMLHLLFHLGKELDPVVTVLLAKVMGMEQEQVTQQDERGIAQVKAYMRALLFASENRSRLWVDA